MSMDALSAHLLRLELFQGLKPLQITEIVRRAEKMVYKPGQTLIAYGEQGDAAIIIVAGEAVRTKAPMAPEGQEEVIEPGSMLGEMAMLIETEYSSTVVARSPVRALRIPRASMLDVMLDDPRLAEHFVAKVARRLHGIAAELRKIDVVLAETGAGPDGRAVTAALPAPAVAASTPA
jgi:CRP-like cAMP-binding protein